MIQENIVKIILSVVLISSFIGIFFFTYEARIEENIVKQQSTEIIQDFMGDFKTLLPPSMLQNVYSAVEPSLVAPDLSVEDENVKESNDALIKHATKIIVIFTVVGLMIAGGLCAMFKINPTKIILNTFITLVFVAIAEFIFVTYLVQNYSTIDSNFVKQKILNIMANYK